MAQEKAPYDAAAAKAAAEELAALAGQDWTPLFPAGSSDGADNRALPAIWENLEDFMIKHKDLIAATAALAPVAGTDLASLKAGFGPVGAACGACHKDYRKPE
jgi:cytochrome c556